MHVGRSEQISECLFSCKKQNQASSYLFSLQKKKQNPPFQSFSLSPSFGYSSLQQEWESLFSEIECHSEFLERYSPKIIFGKVGNSLENEELIKNYENTQLKILEVLDQANWLESVLTQFYGETVKIKVKEDVLLTEPEQLKILNWSNLIAQMLLQNFKEEFDIKDRDKFLEYIDGMEAAEKRQDAHYLAPFPNDLESQYASKNRAFWMGFKTWSFYKFNKGLFPFQAVIKKLKNDEENELDLSKFIEAISYIQWKLFHHIEEDEKLFALSHFGDVEKSSHSTVKCLFADRLYYQQKSPGAGSSINKDQMIKVAYTLKSFYGHVIESAENCTLDLRRAIKAFRKGFPGMQMGEKGILFIHPEWGIKDYFSPPYYSPYLIAEFEILSK